ncbi:YybH family protein [Arthrobacter pascens]|uniref:YybH family protein n=1 Tax=Arthrobacter pascens TaxID=1677 RepID=UPI00196A216D|nr:nuclear transport factor 2 family protein [Arthrobacter pascens]MBN3498513.1 nuclear transport factor 2 family protein [Arthrobacter pascens]
MTVDFEGALTDLRQALDQILRGNADGYKKLYSRRDEITLSNPFGSIVRGWDDVEETLDRAASYYRDGEATNIDTVSQLVGTDVAYCVLVERGRAKVGGSSEISDFAIRVTNVFAREDDGWKLVHRHADTRVELLPAEAILHA